MDEKARNMLILMDVKCVDQRTDPEERRVLPQRAQRFNRLIHGARDKFLTLLWLGDVQPEMLSHNEGSRVDRLPPRQQTQLVVGACAVRDGQLKPKSPTERELAVKRKPLRLCYATKVPHTVCQP